VTHLACPLCGEYHTGDCPEEREWGGAGERDDDLLYEISHQRCDWCGKVKCECDDALFDADELGLDPEDDSAR
jgi:hypothetical protein